MLYNSFVVTFKNRPPVLENLPTNTLPRLLRRTTLSAIAVGTAGFLVAIFVAPPLAALGVAIGVVLAIVNLRFLDKQAANVELRGEQSTKAVRRQLGGKTTGRLAVMTVIVIATSISWAASGRRRSWATAFGRALR